MARLNGWAEEVFYRRLMSVVDDFGRYFADPGLLRAACYPRHLSKVSDSDIGKWISSCETAALVSLYCVDGERYLQLLDFRQQVRAKVSRFPDPPSVCTAHATQTQSSAHLDVDVSVDVGEVVSAAPKNGARHDHKPDDSPVVITLPLRGGGEFPVRQTFVAELEPLYPAVDVPQTLREMKGWLLGKPERRKTQGGVRAFITHWLKEEQAKHGG